MRLNQKSSVLFKILFCSLFIVLSINTLQAQQEEQYLKQLRKYRAESNKVKEAEILNKLAFFYRSKERTQDAIDRYLELLKVNNELGNEKATGTVELYLGQLYYLLDQFDKSIKYCKAAEAEVRKYNPKSDYYNLMLCLTNACLDSGQPRSAIQYADKGLETALELKNTLLIRNMYYKLYESHKKIGNNEKSIEYLDKFNTFDKKLNEERANQVVEESKNRVNEIKDEKDSLEVEKRKTEQKLDEKSDSLTQAQKLAALQKLTIKNDKLKLKEKEAQNQKKQIVIYSLIGGFALVVVFSILLLSAYREKKKANILLDNQNREIQRQKKEIEKQALQLAATNHELEKLSIVASETDNAVAILNLDGDFEWINDGYKRLYGYEDRDILQKLGNVRNLDTSPSLEPIIAKSIETKKTIIFEYSMQTKDGELKTLHSTLTPIFDENRQVKRIIAVDSDITKLKETENEVIRQKNKVESQNVQITDSIRYAKRIQQAILPSDELLNSYLNTFVLYRPKDIVSGDFYWYFDITSEKGMPKTLVAAIDCTGHGVPGAFMSIIGNRLLNEIVIRNINASPAEILDKLNKATRKALNQNNGENLDGMDICLCCIENQNDNQLKIIYSGAKRPLFYIRNGKRKVETLKGDRKSIGGMQPRIERDFTNQELMLEKGDMLYLTSDGYIDQNGPSRKRFGRKRFYNTLLKISTLKLDEQQKVLEDDLEDYQDGEEQRDDITVLGIRL